jgi:hypothetical protein
LEGKEVEKEQVEKKQLVDQDKNEYVKNKQAEVQNLMARMSKPVSIVELLGLCLITKRLHDVQKHLARFA